MRPHAARQTAEKRITLRRLAQPWTLILIITGLFQMFRGAPVDGAFFLGIATLLLADALGWLHLNGLPRPRTGWLLVAAVPLAVVLVLAPRHGVVDGIIVSGIGLSALLIGWSPRQYAEGDASRDTASLPPAIRRTVILWSVIGVICALWEVLSFLLGLPSAEAATRHPSISELFDPALNTIQGRIAFTVAWLLAGVALLHGTTRKVPR